MGSKSWFWDCYSQDVGYRSCYNEQRLEVMTIAVEDEHVEIVQLFLERGIDSPRDLLLDARSLSCWTPKPPLRGCDIPSQGQVKHYRSKNML